MKICKKEDEAKEHVNPPLIMGNLYKRKGGEYIYICAYQNRLVCLEEGVGWDDDEGFGNRGEWIDVTDQYCLTKVK